MTSLFVCAFLAAAAPPDPVEWSLPWLTTAVPGAQVPFGMVTLSPDTRNPETSGYRSTEDIVGFSHTHVSGTGGPSKYGNFLVTPVVGDLALGTAGARQAERASPGFYGVTLSPSGVGVELTATEMVGMHRYTFPATHAAHVLMDVSSVIRLGRNREAQQRPLDCSVEFVPPNRLEGSANFIGGWNPSPYTLHFSAELDREPVARGTWKGETFQPGSTVMHGNHVGAYGTFDTHTAQVVQLKVAVSFVSRARAREHLQQEIPGWDFDAVKAGAAQKWRQALEKLDVSGGSDSDRRQFYTALYHAQVMPHDLSKDNAWWSGSEPHYEDFYCLWDTFRTVHPLLTLIQPERQADMVRSLMDTAEHTGWFPDGRIAGANGLTQNGSNAMVVLADAVVKKLPGVDAERAFRLMQHEAEETSPRMVYEGRDNTDWKTLGYVSLSSPRSASRTLEYSYNDFCLAEVAQATGRTGEAQKYLERSRGWEKLWDTETRSIRPRFADGRWLMPFQATRYYPDKVEYDYWDAPFYEGSSRQYSTFVPHDVAGLMGKLGGEGAFIRWLDELFDKKLYNHKNEPDILAPFLYIHAGRPDRMADRVRGIMADSYGLGRSGLPNSDDAGTLSAWLVFNAMGLYPSAGQGFYYLGSPTFSKSVIQLGQGRTFTIKAQKAGRANRYVGLAFLNGKPLLRPYITHAEVMKGGILQLEMTDKPTSWGTRARPPSRALTVTE